MDADLVSLRHDLHAHPELASLERGTASRVRSFVDACRGAPQAPPSRWVDPVGGTGLALVVGGERQGPRVMLRADLDALPIAEPESLGLPYRSTVVGVSHKCGHDGHSTILCGVAKMLLSGKVPIARGSVVLLWQPAEERGDGAKAVISDPRWAEIRPDFAFGLHNVPGFELGAILTRVGCIASASKGIWERRTRSARLREARCSKQR
eukprot:m51a1_g11843 hypothetical protein (208) ;mRNA; f:465645-466708